MRRGKPPPLRRRPTLRDVAQAAGVSIWTASNTFSNPRRVAEATRQRVLTAADALDFAGPNPGARTLALGRTQTICFAAGADEAAMLLADPAARLVAEGLLAACDRAGFALLLAGRPEGRMADGLALFRTTGPGDARGPTVVVDGEGPSGTSSVRADVGGAAAGLAAHLHEVGHRHIAVLAPPGARERLAGVARGWRGEAPLRVFGAAPPAPRSPGQPAWPTRGDGEAAARAALSARPRPTALLALSDTLAAGALDCANWMGLSVPGDVSIAGLDDLPGSDALGLTTAVVPYRPLGELACDVLIRRLEGEPAAALPQLPSPLILRATTAPPAPAGPG